MPIWVWKNEKNVSFFRLRLFWQTAILNATFWKALTWYEKRTYGFLSSHLQNSNLYCVSIEKVLLKKYSFQISFLKLILKPFRAFDLIQTSKLILDFSSKSTKYWCARLKLILRSYGNIIKSLKDWKQDLEFIFYFWRVYGFIRSIDMLSIILLQIANLDIKKLKKC